MKRFVLYLVLVPIIGPSVRIALDDLIYSDYPFSMVLEHPGLYIWTVYFNWLLPAVAIATADRLVRLDKLLRLVIMAAAGWASISLTIFLLYRTVPGRRWEIVLPNLSVLAGAIAAPLCCLLIDQLNKERLSEFGSAILKAINFFRQWPDRV